MDLCRISQLNIKDTSSDEEWPTYRAVSPLPSILLINSTCRAHTGNIITECLWWFQTALAAADFNTSMSFTCSPQAVTLSRGEVSVTRTLWRKMRLMMRMLMMMLYLKEFIMSPHRLFSQFLGDDLETILNFGLAQKWPSELSGLMPPTGLAAYLF